VEHTTNNKETEMTETQTARNAEILERYEANLLSGETLRLKAASIGSVRGDHVIVGRQAFAHALQTLGRMANESDALAQVAGHVTQALVRTQYQTRHEMGARIADAAYMAVKAGFDDVVGRSGPEGGRFQVKPFNLHQTVAINLWISEAVRHCNPGASPEIGWALAHFARQENVRLP
jgi:hypothetical protein